MRVCTARHASSTSPTASTSLSNCMYSGVLPVIPILTPDKTRFGIKAMTSIDSVTMLDFDETVITNVMHELEIGGFFSMFFKTDQTKQSSHSKRETTSHMAKSKKEHRQPKFENFAHLDLLEMEHKPDSRKGDLKSCWNYIKNTEINLNEFHRQIDQSIREYQTDSDTPSVPEVMYWIQEADEIRSELSQTITILQNLATRLQDRFIVPDVELVRLVKKLISDDIDMRTKFDTVVKKTKSPSIGDLRRWLLRMGLMKINIRNIEKPLARLIAAARLK
jgi:hypothetical protein